MDVLFELFHSNLDALKWEAMAWICPFKSVERLLLASVPVDMHPLLAQTHDTYPLQPFSNETLDGTCQKGQLRNVGDRLHAVRDGKFASYSDANICAFLRALIAWKYYCVYFRRSAG